MKYDFDERVDRTNSNSIKYDFAVERGKPADILPLWVADMDFRAPMEVIERMEQDLELGIFGYSEGKPAYFDALYHWYKENFHWEIQKNWLVKTPGVVFAVTTAIRAFTREGDAVLIQQPVYYPFGESIRDNKRQVINSPLVLVEGHYQMDFEDFENKIIENKVKLFILCSPHNPVGRVWTKEELSKVGEICLKYQVIIVSDEIHSDFTYNGYEHTVIANIDERFAPITITCTAPSKTFNLAGLQISNVFISNRELKSKFVSALKRTGYSQVGMLGVSACQAAYENGREWLDELKQYLTGNLTYIREYLLENIPQIKLIEPEGTYLLWLDFRELEMTEQERENLIVNKAKLWLDSGVMFGKDGEGFERINIACPRATLRIAMESLKKAMDEQ
ncbi:MAG: MalY/PatB family protein [Velocimicrobium sp.]